MLLSIMTINTDRKCLRIGLLNARSLNTGTDELFVTFSKQKPDILAINETWIKEGEENLAPIIPNYKFTHRARKNKRRGGGVGFYVRQGINTRARQHPTSTLEQMWLEVQLPAATLALGTAYRPESVCVPDAFDALSDSIKTVANCNYLCVLGDLNINLIDNSSLNSKELIYFCHQHNLDQIVKEPTRVTEHSVSLLDVILTDSPSKCKNVTVIHNPSLSDYAMVIVDFDVKKQVKFQRALQNIYYELFKKGKQLIIWTMLIKWWTLLMAFV